MQTVEFNAGDTIISEGEEGQSAFLIIEGSVEVLVGESSNAKAVAENPILLKLRNLNQKNLSTSHSLTKPQQLTAV